MNDSQKREEKPKGGAWFSILVAVAIPLLATMADAYVTLWVTFGALALLGLFQWRRGQFKGLVIFPAIGAAIVLSALIVFWLKGRH